MITRREKNNAFTKAWRNKNKDHVSNYNREYRLKNPEKIASYTMFSSIEKVNRQKIRRYEYYNKFCESVIKKGGKVLSEISEYKTAQSKLFIKCKNEHEFSISSCNLNSDKWCPYCCIYQNEMYSKLILEHIFKQDFIKVRPPWLINEEGNRLEIDMYNENLNLAVEYNGIQHYKYIKYFHKIPENFKKCVKNDKLKAKILQDKKINFFVIPYTITNIYEYILEKLSELKINYITPLYPIPKINIFSLNEGMIKLLKIINDKNGKLIEGNYITAKSPATIKCENGHTWSTKMCKILSGSWCRICKKNVNKETKDKIMKEKIESGQISVKIKPKRIRDQIKEKKCIKCTKIKTIDNFNKKEAAADGFQPYCKECMNIAKKEYRNRIITACKRHAKIKFK